MEMKVEEDTIIIAICEACKGICSNKVIKKVGNGQYGSVTDVFLVCGDCYEILKAGHTVRKGP